MTLVGASAAEAAADRALLASGCGTKNHVWEETGPFGKARCTVCRLERMNLYPRERLVPQGIGRMLRSNVWVKPPVLTERLLIDAVKKARGQ